MATFNGAAVDLGLSPSADIPIWDGVNTPVPVTPSADIPIWSGVSVILPVLPVQPIVPPTIGNIFPIEGDSLFRSQPITFTVTSPYALRRVVVTATRGGDIIEEVVHEGIAFAAMYTGGLNSRVNIDGGFHYTILRNGGWRENSVTIHIVAVDVYGNLATKTLGNAQALYTWMIAPTTPPLS